MKRLNSNSNGNRRVQERRSSPVASRIALERAYDSRRLPLPISNDPAALAFSFLSPQEAAKSRPTSYGWNWMGGKSCGERTQGGRLCWEPQGESQVRGDPCRDMCQQWSECIGQCLRQVKQRPWSEACAGLAKTFRGHGTPTLGRSGRFTSPCAELRFTVFTELIWSMIKQDWYYRVRLGGGEQVAESNPYHTRVAPGKDSSLEIVFFDLDELRILVRPKSIEIQSGSKARLPTCISSQLERGPGDDKYGFATEFQPRFTVMVSCVVDSLPKLSQNGGDRVWFNLDLHTSQNSKPLKGTPVQLVLLNGAIQVPGRTTSMGFRF